MSGDDVKGACPFYRGGSGGSVPASPLYTIKRGCEMKELLQKLSIKIFNNIVASGCHGEALPSGGEIEMCGGHN